MKLLDKVRVIVDKKEYTDKGIMKGATGTILLAEIRNNSFLVVFDKLLDEDNDEVWGTIYVGDLEVVQESKIADDIILKDLPSPDPHWWCKVEDGYIKNLLGEKKNKIPYDYES